MHYYLKFFISGFILNNILNIILKLAIKEPKPTVEQKTVEIAVANGIRVDFDKFGMPSGYAQNCGYSLFLIIMLIGDLVVTNIYMIITLICMVERYYNNYSLLQLVTGFVIGLVFGYITYLIANKCITGNIKMRPDDNGPV